MTTAITQIADLGIAFVQNYSGGMTDDMPNNGTGEYSGNFIANVQEADDDGDGDINQINGRTTMTANFRSGMIDIDLVGLAMLEASIVDGTSTFMGTEDATVTDDPHALDSMGDFEGSVSGAFFGDEAIEAGGVFDYASEDNEAGAFRGAFGSYRTDE